MINRRRVLELFLELAKVNSPPYGERLRADILKGTFAGAGITLEEDDFADAGGGNCGNLYAYIPGDTGQTPLLFSAHLDSIGDWQNKKVLFGYDGIIKTDGNSILGADDCGGLAVITEAALSLVESGVPHRPIELLFTAAEEVYACGVRHVPADRIKSREAYVFDLTGPAGTAAYAAPTIMGFTCEFIGREAHAGFEPEAGVSAIRAASAAILKMPSGRVGDVTVNAGTIEGGSATNVVPGRCLVKGEVRSLDHSKACEMCDEILKIAGQAANEYGAEFNGTFIENARAYRTDTQAAVVSRYAKACAQAGIEPAFIETYGGSDLNELCKLGITGIVSACGMYLCHGTNEYSDAYDLLKMANVALYLMRD